MAAHNNLNGFSGFGLAVFIAVSKCPPNPQSSPVNLYSPVFCVIYPIRIPLPLFIKKPLRSLLVACRLVEPDIKPAADRWTLKLSLETAPFIGVILLLITTTINGSVVKLGIIGEEGVRPYDVLVLFICLVSAVIMQGRHGKLTCERKAYISISLDATGALRALAFLVSQKGGTRGGLLCRILHPFPSRIFSDALDGSDFYLYCFFFFFGVIVGNVCLQSRLAYCSAQVLYPSQDPIILSGTAFLAYFTRHNAITPPTAWTFAEFIAANMGMLRPPLAIKN